MIMVTGHGDGDGREWLTVEYTTDAEELQLRILLRAAEVYAVRNVEYNDNWRRMGWRGMLVRVRERAERLWDSLFWSDPPETDYTVWKERKLDDAYDLINFAAFLIRAVEAANRDGNWWQQPR